MNRRRSHSAPVEPTPADLRGQVRALTAQLDALRESEATYRQLHQTRIDAFARVSLDGRIEETNELFQRMVGYTADELRALRYMDLTPERWHEFEAGIVTRQVLGRGRSELYEKEYRRRDGAVFPVEIRAFLIRDADGAPAGMAAVVRDITERRRAEQELRDEVSERKRSEQTLLESREALAESQEALLALINSTNDLIWSVDPQAFGLVTFNNALRTYFGRRGVDIRPGMTPADLLPPAFAECWPRFYRRALQDGPFVEQYVTASATPVLLLSFNLVKRAGVVSAISVFGKDITDRIEAQEALRRSEGRFRTLIEDAPVAIRVGRNKRTLYANRRYLDLFGYDEADELLGRPVADQWAPECHEDVVDLTMRLEAGFDAPIEYEGVARRKDGTLFPAHAAIGLVQLPDGPALIIYLTDISDRKAAEAAMRDLSGRLIDAQEAERSRVARELHDDFSQRLALLAVNLDLLRQTIPGASVETVQASVNGLHVQVQALAKDVRRMSHDLHPARLTQLGLAAAVRGLCADVSGAHRLKIDCAIRDVPREVPPAVALCVYRVAQESLQNVIKHSGASAARVELTAADGELCLVVSDRGCGFDATAARRADSLGLANIRERVRLISGRLAIDSAPGRGTRIELRARAVLSAPHVEPTATSPS
ncbi:MAG: PAS domain S-box protein [Bacteroidales bacterium]